MNDKKLKDICFPVPQEFALTAPATIDSNEKVKKHLFQQTLQAAYRKQIPSSFTSSYGREKPHQLVTDEEVESIVALFQALQPKDALEAALAQQFIIVHTQAIEGAKSGVNDKDIKRFALTHQILESLTKYRNKGAQLINVQYNHNQGQINNINVIEKEDSQLILADEL